MVRVKQYRRRDEAEVADGAEEVVAAGEEGAVLLYCKKEKRGRLEGLVLPEENVQNRYPNLPSPTVRCSFMVSLTFSDSDPQSLSHSNRTSAQM